MRAPGAAARRDYGTPAIAKRIFCRDAGNDGVAYRQLPFAIRDKLEQHVGQEVRICPYPRLPPR
jgi:hypothetical protein